MTHSVSSISQTSGTLVTSARCRPDADRTLIRWSARDLSRQPLRTHATLRIEFTQLRHCLLQLFRSAGRSGAGASTCALCHLLRTVESRRYMLSCRRKGRMSRDLRARLEVGTTCPFPRPLPNNSTTYQGNQPQENHFSLPTAELGLANPELNRVNRGISARHKIKAIGAGTHSRRLQIEDISPVRIAEIEVGIGVPRIVKESRRVRRHQEDTGRGESRGWTRAVGAQSELQFDWDGATPVTSANSLTDEGLQCGPRERHANQ